MAFPFFRRPSASSLASAGRSPSRPARPVSYPSTSSFASSIGVSRTTSTFSSPNADALSPPLPPLKDGEWRSALLNQPEFVSTRRKLRAVICGQHPSKVKTMADLISAEEEVEVVAAVSDLLDARTVLIALTFPVDVFICGAYFGLQDARDVVSDLMNTNGDEIQFIKVPEDLMMSGGGPPAVRDYILTELRAIFPAAFD